MFFDAITSALGVLVSIIGFYIKRLYDEVDSLRKELSSHKEHDAREYITRTEMRELTATLKEDLKNIVSPISDKLQSIEEFLRKP